ncbi:Tigger transposable element-derived protein 4 [Oopsacas minuta]|uniref:Tigger transposable element-derived protein 4 n=1 Tax=Oopsacas minuta TaxID=111878 RepID=A0AAV7JVX6_9METZ|nr:Tigger transposable element-derived protein 4 [Oopsacas minuta]
MAPAAKRKPISTHEDLDTALLVWFIDAPERSVPIDGNMLMSKINILERYTTFTLFHHVVGYKAGENAIAFLRYSMEKPPLLTHRLHTISSLYKFLQFCLITHFQTTIIVMRLTFSTNVYQNLHINLVRIKMLFVVLSKTNEIYCSCCCNADGSDKVRLTIIGKYANPHPLKDCMRALPVNYRYNTKAWML